MFHLSLPVSRTSILDPTSNYPSSVTPSDPWVQALGYRYSSERKEEGHSHHLLTLLEVFFKDIILFLQS